MASLINNFLVDHKQLSPRRQPRRGVSNVKLCNLRLVAMGMLRPVETDTPMIALGVISNRCYVLSLRKIFSAMKISVTSRFITACLLLVSLLFTQLAIASYACPTMSPNKPAVVTTMADSTSNPMADSMQPMASGPCQHQDLAQPALCHAQTSDTVNKLSLDKPNVPAVAMFLPVRMAQTIYFFDPHSASPSSVTLARESEPSSTPTAILLHCCFRI